MRRLRVSFAPGCGASRRRSDDGRFAGWQGEEPPGIRRGLSGRRVFDEFETDANLHRDTGEIRSVRRSVDRSNNWYSERIESPDGTLARHREHPLHEHHEHGSAKRPEHDRGLISTEEEWGRVEADTPGKWQWDAAESGVRCSHCPALWTGTDGLGQQDQDEIRRHGASHDLADDDLG